VYKAHFGLTLQPFGLTPDTSFFLNTQGHREAFNILQVSLANGEGFIKVVGEVGTGKTMLCRKLLNTLDDSYCTAYVPNPFLNPAALYRAIAQELGVHCKTRDGIHEYQQGINNRLIELVAEGKRVVLVIDEAQVMPMKSLEALRLISNLETETTRLIHIVLFGQPELDRLLEQEEIRQLKQRITFAYRLPPLDLVTTRQYLLHRATIAGFNGGALFTEAAIKLLYKASKGVPRLINILAHKSLIAAYGKGVRQVDRSHVKAAIVDSEGVNMPGWLYQWGWSAAAVVVFSSLMTLFFAWPVVLS
jgi:MSHA biogenesis protein MshM